MFTTKIAHSFVYKKTQNKMYYSTNNCKKMEELNKLSDSQVYQLLVNKSKEFLLKEYKYNSFPTQNNLIENVNKIIRKTNKEYIQKIGNFARNISPLLHEDVLSLIRDFINFKKQTNSVESRVYSKYPDFNVLSLLSNKIIIKLM